MPQPIAKNHSSKNSPIGLLKTLFKLILAVGLILWIYDKGYLDVAQLKFLFSAEHLIVCFLLVAANLGLCHWRWLTLLRSRGFKSTYINLLPLSFIGLFFNFAIPGGVGGDLVKGFYLVADQPQRKTDAAMTILLDRVLGLYGMFILATLSLVVVNFGGTTAGFASGSAQSITWFVLGLSVSFTVFLSITWSSQVKIWTESNRVLSTWRENKLFGKFFEVYSAMQSYQEKPRAILKALLISLAAQVMSVVFFWYVGSVSLASNFSFLTYLFVVPVGFVITAVPISPGGIGVGQMAFLFLTTLYTGQKSEIGPLALTMFQILLFSIGLLGGYFYIRRGRNAR